MNWLQVLSLVVQVQPWLKLLSEVQHQEKKDLIHLQKPTEMSILTTTRCHSERFMSYRDMLPSVGLLLYCQIVAAVLLPQRCQTVLDPSSLVKNSTPLTPRFWPKLAAVCRTGVCRLQSLGWKCVLTKEWWAVWHESLKSIFYLYFILLFFSSETVQISNFNTKKGLRVK